MPDIRRPGVSDGLRGILDVKEEERAFLLDAIVPTLDVDAGQLAFQEFVGGDSQLAAAGQFPGVQLFNNVAADQIFQLVSVFINSSTTQIVDICLTDGVTGHTTTSLNGPITNPRRPRQISTSAINRVSSAVSPPTDYTIIGTIRVGSNLTVDLSPLFKGLRLDPRGIAGQNGLGFGFAGNNAATTLAATFRWRAWERGQRG